MVTTRKTRPGSLRNEAPLAGHTVLPPPWRVPPLIARGADRMWAWALPISVVAIYALLRLVATVLVD